jgi:predicted MPP superfamily phosphohydrolase
MPRFRHPLGNADHRSAKQQGGFAGRAVVISSLVLLALVLFMNFRFLNDGMLAPNFSLINKAFTFNLVQLPWFLIVLSLLYLLAAGFLNRRYLIGVFFFAFLAFDLIGLRYYVTQIEPYRLKVRSVQILTPKLTEPLRILHLSDIQAGEITDYEVRLFQKISKLKPDLIINTGDYLQVVPPATFEGEFPKLMRLMHSLKPRYGSYGVFGDTDLNLLRIPLKDLEPFQILSSRAETIKTSGGTISLHGLSLYESKNPDWASRGINHWLEQSPLNNFRILMGHSPNFVFTAKDTQVDLCLAGHTHGGQVRIPFVGPLVIDSIIPKEWSRGATRIGSTLLNVSAGAGSNRFKGLPRLRFNCPTEITLIDLIPAQSKR